MMTRRTWVAGLMALAALPACPRRPPPEPPPDRLRLGWRLIPGDRLIYQTRTTLRRPGRAEIRVERWSYLVTERRSNVASLEGHLIGLGGLAEREDLERSLLEERERGARVALRLGMDGRLRPRATGACGTLGEPDRACFGRQLAHRLLALPLPDEAVGTGQSWPDRDLPASFVPLLATDEEATVERSGACALLDIYRDGEGAPRVVLGSTVLVRSAPGLALRVDGRATWDPARGVLIERSLQARVGGAAAGELDVHLTRVG